MLFMRRKVRVGAGGPPGVAVGRVVASIAITEENYRLGISGQVFF